MATVNITLFDTTYGLLCVFYESYKLNITIYRFYFLNKILSKLKKFNLRFKFFCVRH